MPDIICQVQSWRVTAHWQVLIMRDNKKASNLARRGVRWASKRDLFCVVHVVLYVLWGQNLVVKLSIRLNNDSLWAFLYRFLDQRTIRVPILRYLYRLQLGHFLNCGLEISKYLAYSDYQIINGLWCSTGDLCAVPYTLHAVFILLFDIINIDEAKIKTQFLGDEY